MNNILNNNFHRIRNVSLKDNKKNITKLLIEFVSIFACFSFLIKTDAYFTPYFLISIIAFLCFFINKKNRYLDFPSFERKNINIFSSLFSLMVTFSNYNLWWGTSFEKIISFVFILFGSFFAFSNILKTLIAYKANCCWKESKNKIKSTSIFLLSFSIMFVIYLSILFLSEYPGNLSFDSIDQMTQILNNKYSNHHPFYHTMVIKIFVELGFFLFNDINKAVCVYSIFSAFTMSCIFAFSIFTLHQIKVPRFILVLCIMFFSLMPYHISYSITMWKDVFFGGAVLLFIVFFFRIVKNLNLKMFNYIGLIISSIAFCLFRSNGTLAFLFTAILTMALIYIKSIAKNFPKIYINRKILYIMFVAWGISFILKYPVLSYLDVKQPALLEKIAIPSQQVIRDIRDNEDLSINDKKLLSNVMDINAVSDAYLPYIFGKSKSLISKQGNQNYIKEHSGEFLKFYLTRLFKHPSSYIMGWIDETRGFWNSGYYYWKWWNLIENNNLNIVKKINCNSCHTIYSKYIRSFETIPMLQIFISIGFFNWLTLISLFVAIIRRDLLGIIITAPLIMIVGTLLLATPVFAEFRYNYAVFCAMPFIMSICFQKKI